MRIVAVILLAGLAYSAAAQSPYAGEEQRAIKSLSPAEINSLRSGQGMGFAKAAELNSYPGPRHVLELADELELSASQRQQSEALFNEMRTTAIALGNELVEAEAALDRQFEQGVIDSASLQEALLAIGETRARLRFTHLEAHLRQKAILSNDQVAKYDSLRGYAVQRGNHDGHRHHHGPGDQARDRYMPSALPR